MWYLIICFNKTTANAFRQQSLSRQKLELIFADLFEHAFKNVNSDTIDKSFYVSILR